MFPWLGVWAPHLNFPWSGSVAQTIEPDLSWFFNGIQSNAGMGRVERKVFDKASYGTQLGWLIDVLTEVAAPADSTRPALSAGAQTSLDKLVCIKKEVAKLKQEEAAAMAQQVEEHMIWLRQHSPAQFAQLGQRLQALAR